MDAPAPADFYTGLVADLYRPLRGSAPDPDVWARLCEAIGPPALELGCGDGDPLLDLRARGLQVEGLDASADMLERAQARMPHRSLAEMIGRELMALAAQHALGGCRQGLDRQDLGIVVAADEIVGRMAVPARRGRRQVGGEQGIEGDHRALPLRLSGGGATLSSPPPPYKGRPRSLANVPAAPYDRRAQPTAEHAW